VKDLDDEQSKSLEDSCLTETLARIYIKQKRYDKALQIIKNLSLKYPEKNVYFADQIRFLEKLIINTKK
jgi:thioredoxin-like negative regulator of GroEL